MGETGIVGAVLFQEEVSTPSPGGGLGGEYFVSFDFDVCPRRDSTKKGKGTASLFSRSHSSQSEHVGSECATSSSSAVIHKSPLKSVDAP